MKRIMLAPRGKRMLASLIDALILIISTAVVYLTAVMPFTFDDAKIKENNLELIDLYKTCELFLTDEEGNTESKNEFKQIRNLNDLYSVEVPFGGKKETIHITQSLYIYYTTQHENYAGTVNYDLDTFKSEILKVNDLKSNIADFDPTTYKFTLMDEAHEETTYNFIRVLYRNITSDVANKGRIGQLNEENTDIVVNSFLLVLPVLLGFSLIFNLIIPLCSPFGQTIGKHIFKLIVLNKDGYHLPKPWLILRWLCYIIIEFIGGICTFGATFLISYTMFLFNKKRRSLHDYCANSVVADRRDSIFFKNEQEERYFEERLSKQGGLNVK